MKKLFVAVLALAALAACNKDSEMQFIQSNKKAVVISIANGVKDTRAVEAIAAVDTNKGGVATLETPAEAGACAETDELVVLFADANGKVIDARTFPQATGTETTDGTSYEYRYHDVDESVTQVAVVRYVPTKDAEAVVATAEFIGQPLSTYRDAAANVDVHENVDLKYVSLYACNDLGSQVDTCTVEDPNDHKTTFTYALYEVSLRVAPTIARVEIVGFACDGSAKDSEGNAGVELGSQNWNTANGDGVETGYDKLTLNSIAWGGFSDADKKNPYYSYTFASDAILTGIYKGEGNTEKAERVDYYPKKDGADVNIAWNIDPTAVVPTIAGIPMVVSMTADAHDYTPAVTAKTLSIEFTGVTAFEPGKIYRMDVKFGENNLDASNEAICVNVEVEIVDWVVVTVEPTYGNY